MVRQEFLNTNYNLIKKYIETVFNHNPSIYLFVIHIVKKHSERNMFNVVLQNKKKIGCIIASKELMSKLPELD